MLRRLDFVFFSAALLCLQIQLTDAQNNPSAYAPNVNVECPSTPLLRTFSTDNQSLNTLEQDYIQQKEAVSPQAWKAWLGNGSALGYNLSQFEAHFPRIAIAACGGGLRAALYDVGSLSGFDARNDSSVAAGTGGLLQVASYLSGLSGGSWAVGSLFFNDFPPMHDLVLGDSQSGLSGWELSTDLAAPAGDDLFNKDNQYYYGSLLWSVYAKADKGLDTNNFFTNDSSHGAGILWSNMPNIPAFANHSLPFPIIMADSRPIGSNLTTILANTATVYEITPFEFGSFDPGLQAMTNTSFIGTHLNNGQPPNATGCVQGFDQASFMIGTSASLFNQILDTVHNTLQSFDPGDSSGLLYVLERQLTEVRTRSNDVANWPNPFQSINSDTFHDSNSSWLDLIDGATNIENVPIGPLFVKARGIDVVVALDGSADTSFSWPNGTSMLFSQQRFQEVLSETHQAFPPIPETAADFLNTGASLRPTFFGCFPAQNPPEFPLVLYFPNAPPSNGDDPVTNTDTFKLSYTDIHTSLFLDQIQAVTRGGFVPNEKGADPNFGNCLQCAAIDRARYKVNPTVPRSSICSQCFQQYCYDQGNPPAASEIVGRTLAFKDPDPQGVSQVEGFLSKNKIALILGLVGLAVVTIASIFLIFEFSDSSRYFAILRGDMGHPEDKFDQTELFALR
ncbi:hypothetical protein EW145_g4517 [Phellinidium pouzarii]|uniref:Lysophospholipase n=1 Tax=Phellinidium pouzarii TaxID=167371 RepID=A0A4S4L3Q2_9AGAM|nr:hypothetical protein EW145_g4517 [Phellinidium pouzarii]